MSRGQANLLTTGALGRRVAQIARLLPKGPSWSRTGQPLDMSHVIWGILADVQRHAKARRGLQAGEALKRAEELVRANRATIREAKRRELEEAAAERRA